MKNLITTVLTLALAVACISTADAFVFRRNVRVNVNNFNGIPGAAGFQFSAPGRYYAPRSGLNFNFNSGSGYNYLPPSANFNFNSGYNAQGQCGGTVVQDPVTGRFFFVR